MPKMTLAQAYARLQETRELSTAMLPAFGISLDAFLHYAQLPEAKQQQFVTVLLNTYAARVGGGAHP